jgi:hypothetical protein
MPLITEVLEGEATECRKEKSQTPSSIPSMELPYMASL